MNNKNMKIIIEELEKIKNHREINYSKLTNTLDRERVHKNIVNQIKQIDDEGQAIRSLSKVGLIAGGIATMTTVLLPILTTVIAIEGGMYLRKKYNMNKLNNIKNDLKNKK